MARADKRARYRRRCSKTHTRTIENNTQLAREIETQFDPLMPSETIAREYGIHHQTIYDWIYRSRPNLKHLLPQQGRKRRRYGSKREKKQGWRARERLIDERPDITLLGRTPAEVYFNCCNSG